MSSEPVIVVTGLPRSGTSLMMQMLAAAGVPVLTDSARAADDDNPRGYLEFAPVKAIARDASWLARARGKAVKIVAPLLPHLRDGERYAAIWMERNLEEVLASQATMLERSGRAVGDDDRVLRRAYERQVDDARADLQRLGASVLSVDYARSIAQPDDTAEQVCDFLGGGLDIGAAAATVEPLLYRHRSV